MKTQVLALIALAGQTVFASAETQIRRLRDGHGMLHVDVRPAVSLAFTEKAEDQLLHFLETERSLESSAASVPPYEDFMPACLDHTKELVQSVDQSYTDMQLRKVLEDECLRDKEFSTVEDGFDDHQACMKFAKELSAARMKELKTGSDKGYKAFCERFYVSKGGEKPKKKKKQKKVAKLDKEEEEEQPEQEDEKMKAEKKHSKKTVAAPAAAPIASPMAAPVASPAAAPGPAPAGFAPAPAEAAEIREDEEEPVKKKKAAKKGSKKKDDLIWWAIALIISGLVLFLIAGLIVYTRNR